MPFIIRTFFLFFFVWCKIRILILLSIAPRLTNFLSIIRHPLTPYFKEEGTGSCGRRGGEGEEPRNTFCNQFRSRT